MSKEHLSRKPHSIRGKKDIWWYETEKGIDVVTYRAEAGNVMGRIPWHVIRVALKRLDREQ